MTYRFSSLGELRANWPLREVGCVPAVYTLWGTSGVNRGEGKCIQRRIPQKLRELRHAGRSVGRLRLIEIDVEPDHRTRVVLQNELIKADWAAHRQSRNPILAEAPAPRRRRFR